MEVNEKKLFLVSSSLLVYPEFFISCENILDAGICADKIIKSYNEKGTINSIREWKSSVLLELVESI